MAPSPSSLLLWGLPFSHTKSVCNNLIKVSDLANVQSGKPSRPRKKRRVMRRQRPRRGKQIVAIYDYRDKNGNILFRVRRHHPKGFSVVRADDSPLSGPPAIDVLYRLPELLASSRSDWVFVVEGEKDVECLVCAGLVATCNAFGGGDGKWKKHHSRHLRGRRVAVIPDNDATGRTHAACVADALAGVASDVRVVNLTGVPHKGDASDWFDSGGTPSQLRGMIEATPKWTAQPNPRAAPRGHSYESYDLFSPEYMAGRDDALRELSHILDAPLPPTQKLLLIIIAKFPGATQQQLAGRVGVSARRTRQMIAELTESGWLKAIRHGRKNRYNICPPN
jgi:hypothetical protein